MTLSRQLVLLILALTLVAFMGAFFISLKNTRDYLETQLASHAQDAATSLGLSISSHLAEQDLVTVSRMADAIFDRGYYRRVQVEDIKGNVVLERQLTDRSDGVPLWFIHAIPLNPPEGEALVMSGWKQAGHVHIVSHPGFAYRQLWNSAAQSFWLFLISQAVIAAAGLWLLRVVLRPLKTVEWQAECICKREFPLVEKLPSTPDLRRIVVAMNRMTSRVQGMLIELERMAAAFREQAHQSPVTGLANKRFFMDNLGHRLESEEEFQQGGLFLVQLKEFKSYNDRFGYQAGDKLLQAAAGVLRQMAETLPKSLPAHLAGADFALLVEDVPAAEMEALARQLSEQLSGLVLEGEQSGHDIAHVGAIHYGGGLGLSELLSHADLALRTAQAAGPNAWHIAKPAVDETTRTGSEWRQLIEGALAHGDLQLHFQPVVSVVDNSLLHREVFVRLQDGRQLLTAGLFMPMADRFGLTAEIDRMVVERALTYLEMHPDRGTLAVNLSPASLRSSRFIAWLEGRLDASSASGRLVFELPEYGAVAMLSELQALQERLSGYGTRIALDHFGRGFASFAYLQSLKVEYLKIDGSYVRQLENRDHEFFIKTLTEIAHGLEIQVYADSVESAELWARLRQLGLDGGQGYYLGRPAA